MQTQLTPSADETRLSLNGELTLLHVGQVKSELTRALESSERVIIDMEDLSAIDLAGLQLICSAHQSALSRGKELILNPRQPEVLRRQIARSGLLRRRHCGARGDAECYWNGGDR